MIFKNYPSRKIAHDAKNIFLLRLTSYKNSNPEAMLIMTFLQFTNSFLQRLTNINNIGPNLHFPHSKDLGLLYFPGI